MQSIRPRNEPCIEVIDDQMAEIQRKKLPAEKIEMIAAAGRTARMLAKSGVRYFHPDWNEEQIQAEVLRRITCGSS